MISVIDKIRRWLNPPTKMEKRAEAISEILRRQSDGDFISVGTKTQQYLKERHKSFVEMMKLKDQIEASKEKS